MTNVAYSHLDTPNNNILSDVKVGGFRLAGRRRPREPISTVSFDWPQRRFIHLGLTILGDLISISVSENISVDIAAACKARAIEAVNAWAAYQRICEQTRSSDGAERLAFSFGEQERT